MFDVIVIGAGPAGVVGGTTRRRSGREDAWQLKSIPPSMIVIGAGATGAQVASLFNAFGSKVQLFHAGPPTNCAD